MASNVRTLIPALLTVALLSACVSINSMTPDTASVVGFVVPEGTADGTYTVKVRDGVGVLEVITILPLLRLRSDSATLVVGAE